MNYIKLENSQNFEKKVEDLEKLQTKLTHEIEKSNNKIPDLFNELLNQDENSVKLILNQ